MHLLRVMIVSRVGQVDSIQRGQIDGDRVLRAATACLLRRGRHERWRRHVQIGARRVGAAAVALRATAFPLAPLGPPILEPDLYEIKQNK